MIIIKIDGQTREENIQRIIVNKNDKYGLAMIAYFKNSLNGQNVAKLSIKNKNDVQFIYDRINKVYILQIFKFSIENKCIITNYKNFKNNYNELIKDKISHI